MKSTGTRSPNELQKLDLKIRNQDSSSINGHQGDIPHWFAMQYITEENPWVISHFTTHHNHGWRPTQHIRIAHNLAAHHRAVHNTAARWCAGSVVCNLPRPRRWTNVSPTYTAVWLVMLWRGLPIRVTVWVTARQCTTESLGCMQLGGVLLGYVEFGII